MFEACRVCDRKSILWRFLHYFTLHYFTLLLRTAMIFLSFVVEMIVICL